MYKGNMKKIGKMAVICGLCMVLMPMPAGCGSAAKVYVKQQEKDNLTGSEDSLPQEEKESGSGQSPEENQDADSRSAQRTGSQALEDASSAESAAGSQIYVQVSGAVVHPGVYQLAEGSRIFQAVELAGGMTGEADINSVNQAQVLNDGQMVYVYAVGEQRELVSGEQQSMVQTADSQTDDRVNLNTATPEELMTLPGIGQSKAESIISYREEHGMFQSVEDIMNIEGIKEGVFTKIEDQIKVN